jgi:hypothetical protein
MCWIAGEACSGGYTKGRRIVGVDRQLRVVNFWPVTLDPPATVLNGQPRQTTPTELLGDPVADEGDVSVPTRCQVPCEPSRLRINDRPSELAIVVRQHSEGGVKLFDGCVDGLSREALNLGLGQLVDIPSTVGERPRAQD